MNSKVAAGEEPTSNNPTTRSLVSLFFFFFWLQLQLEETPNISSSSIIHECTQVLVIPCVTKIMMTIH